MAHKTNPASVHVKFRVAPSGSCPVQAEGTINGREFYFRARADRWTLHIGKNPGQNPLGVNSIKVERPYTGSAPTAGHASQAECRDFIWKTAPFLLQKLEQAD